MREFIYITIAGFAWLGPHMAAAQSACAGIKGDAERLACFDRSAQIKVVKPSASPILAKAKAAILAELKDPTSAKFEDVHQSGGAVCGRVNAKNSFGGYVGPKAFVYVLATGEWHIFIPQSSIDTDNVHEAMAGLNAIGSYCGKPYPFQ